MASLKHLKLLQSVLHKLIYNLLESPELEALGEHLVCVRSKLRAVMPDEKSRAASVENALKRVANADGVPRRLQETLTALECLIAADAFPAPMYERTIEFPKLFALSKTDQVEDACLFQTQASGFERLVTRATSAIDDLETALHRMVPSEPLVSSTNAQNYIHDSPEFNPYKYREHANEVFDAVGRYWEGCRKFACGGQHETLLFMGTDQTPDLLFDLLFNREKPGLPPWGECLISGPKEEPKFDFKFVYDLHPGASPCSRFQDYCLELDFFTAIHKPIGERGRLGREGLIAKVRPGVENATLASLGDILLQTDEPVTWSNEIKVVMALLFAYSTLAFSGTSWLPHGTSKHGIFFLQDAKSLFLEPLFSSYSQTVGENTRLDLEETTRHDDPRRLALGVLLTELWKEEGWETKVDDLLASSHKAGDILSATRAMLQNTTWNNHMYFAEAISACVEPRSLPNSQRSSFDDKSYQDFLQQKILTPLLEELLNFPDLSPKTLRLYLEDKVVPSVQKGESELVQLYHMKRTSKDAQLQRARALVNELQETVARFASADSAQVLLPVKDRPRVGIAILDTGLDFKHSSFQKQLSEMKFHNFAEHTRLDRPLESSKPESCKDAHGHGTFIAGIINQIRQISTIHIGKIAEEPKNIGDRKEFAEVVAKAIRHACDEWKVKIINLSFGFPSWTDDLQPMKSALEYAKSVNVLVFAASHNFGNTWPSSWPAKEINLVIPVTSADIDGKLSSFAKQPISGLPAVMALGEHITSDWASPKSPGRHFTNQVLGGASFATPIVVCMAALAIYTVAAVKTERDSADTVKDLRSLDVMKFVLTKEFVENPESNEDLRFVKPSFLFRKDYSLADVAEAIRAAVKKKKKRL